MGWVEEADRSLLEQPYQKQPGQESSDMSEPGDSSSTLTPAEGSLKQLEHEVESQNDSSRDIHHRPKEAQRNQHLNPCPRIQ